MHGTVRWTFGGLAAAAVLVVTLMAAGTLGTRQVEADGAGSPGECWHTGSKFHTAPQSPADFVVGDLGPGTTYNAAAGNTVEYVCIKAGNSHSEPLEANGYYNATYALVGAPDADPTPTDACFLVTGIGTSSVTVSQVGSCQAAGLSHYDVGVNGDTPPPTRTIRIIKVTNGDGSGLPQTFEGTIDPHAGATWSAQGGAGPNGGPPTNITGVSTSAQTVTENTPPTNWTLNGYNVREGLFDNCSAVTGYSGTEATIPAGSLNYTVCIKNTFEEPEEPTRTVRIIKVTEGFDGDPIEFTGTISDHTPGTWSVMGGPGAGSGAIDDIENVDTNAHTVVEDEPLLQGWTLNGYNVRQGIQDDCDGVIEYGSADTGAVIEDDGNNYTVCILNTFEEPEEPQTRTIQVIKVTSEPAATVFSGSIQPLNDTWSLQGGAGAAGGTADVFTGVPEVAQTVVENVPPAGWAFDGYAVLAGLVDCSSLDPEDYGGSRTDGASVPATGNWTVCVRNVAVPDIPPPPPVIIVEIPTPTTPPPPPPPPPPSPTPPPPPTEIPTDDGVVGPVTPVPTTPPAVISGETPAPPAAGTGAGGGSDNSWLLLAMLGAVIMGASATLAYATSRRR